MTFHTWGSGWPHWEELNDAGDYIADYVYRHSWCRLSWKEKWGTLRYEEIYPPAYKNVGPIITLPFIKQTIDGRKYPIYLLFWTSSWLYYKWRAYGVKQMRIAIDLACEKFPNVKAEIREDYWEWDE